MKLYKLRDSSLPLIYTTIYVLKSLISAVLLDQIQKECVRVLERNWNETV
jgi:hypothetical protein